MKPSPKYDFPITVRHQTREEELEVSRFYEGIFDVILNHTISVMFVPSIERYSGGWPPILPDNFDDIATELEARLINVAFSAYTVTPNSLLAQKEEIVSLIGVEEPRSGIVFYVTPEEFKVFSSELYAIEEQLLGIHDSRRVSQLKDFKFSQLLLSRIIKSRHFAQKDLRILGR